VTIVGARPQFIKAAPLSQALAARHEEFLVHTGQHYDDEMSAAFFRDLRLRQPDVNLDIGSGPHGRQTGAMLAAIEEILLRVRPDVVVVYGDTNSTLAGGLAAAKLHIPVAHVEAGVRSYNRRMPEEINRVLVDHLAAWLFCPTASAVRILSSEGIVDGVHLVGDVMLDALEHYLPLAEACSPFPRSAGMEPGSYAVLTLHRPENVDDPERLSRLMTALRAIEMPVLFPVHPRTRQRLTDGGFLPPNGSSLTLLPPLGYLDMLKLTRWARVVLTDSGGLQREAGYLRVPSVILRAETEWPELVECGASRLEGEEFAELRTERLAALPPAPRCTAFGDGAASPRIVEALASHLDSEARPTRRAATTERAVAEVAT
jgi:UDP-N-acetylglucosamine 2-epimerase